MSTKCSFFLFLLQCIMTKYSLADMEGFIVGGAETTIQKYPHSVFMGIECVTFGGSDSYVCGASVLNQKFLLSAAHCFEECDPDRSTAAVAVGSALKKKLTEKVAKIYMHEDYDMDLLFEDISLIMLKRSLMLNPSVKRVLVTPYPPYSHKAYVAGWGLIDEVAQLHSVVLKEALQLVVPRQTCLARLGMIPERAFCAENSLGYAAQGDSGSALVVNGFVQIGIVSYKNMDIQTTLVVYTNVSSYYDWINRNMRRMAC